MKHEFILPRSFRPTDYLPLRLATRSDDARWLVSVILRKTAYRDVDPWGCVRLHTGIMRRIMGQNTISPIIRALEDGEAIETAPYCPEVKCRGFRLAKQFLGDRCVRVPATDPRLIKRIEAERQRQEQEDQRSRWKPIHYMLDDEQRYVTITTDANEILGGLRDNVRLCQSVLVDNLRRRRLPLSVSSTGRVFNCITGLKRELRAALRLDGEPMGSVDIRNAQPALLSMLLSQKFPPRELKPRETYIHATPEVPALLPAPALILSCSEDARSFETSVAGGSFYETLMAETGLDRPSVKLAFLRDVLAKRGRYPSAVESVFRDQFPSVYRLIRHVNRRDHGELIRLLQRAESWLVIENVAPRLVGDTRIISLHDAIFSRRRDVSRVQDAFEEVFGELGFQMKTKVEEG